MIIINYIMPTNIISNDKKLAYLYAALYMMPEPVVSTEPIDRDGMTSIDIRGLKARDIWLGQEGKHASCEEPLIIRIFDSDESPAYDADGRICKRFDTDEDESIYLRKIGWSERSFDTYNMIRRTLNATKLSNIYSIAENAGKDIVYQSFCKKDSALDHARVSLEYEKRVVVAEIACWANISNLTYTFSRLITRDHQLQSVHGLVIFCRRKTGNHVRKVSRTPEMQKIYSNVYQEHTDEKTFDSIVGEPFALWDSGIEIGKARADPDYVTAKDMFSSLEQISAIPK